MTEHICNKQVDNSKINKLYETNEQNTIVTNGTYPRTTNKVSY